MSGIDEVPVVEPGVTNDVDVTPEPPPPATEQRDGDSTTTKKGASNGRKVSVVWDHFTPFTDANGKAKARCKYCPQEYMADTKKNGTSNLLNHLDKCKRMPSSRDPKQCQLSLTPIHKGQDENSNLSAVTTWKFDAELCRKKLIEMIIKDELPFKLVDGEGFRDFVKTLQPRFNLISRWTISRDCYDLFLHEKQKLRDWFIESRQSVCITTDTWTSLQRMNYICITAHYVDKDWKLNKRILNFCTIERHRGEDMGRQIDACLREWGIASIISITVDNASSNDTCLSYLKNRLSSRGVSLVRGKFLHMRCMAHIVALIVNDGLKEINSSVKRIREAVRFVRQSPSRLVKFRECCKEENISCNSLLCLDVPTRWNSTYLMLSVACKFEKTFDTYAARDPFLGMDIDEGAPLAFDWDNGRRMSELLKAFYDLTLRISGTQYVTCNNFLHDVTGVSDMLRNWEASDDENVKSMGVRMRSKFAKYWGDPTKMNHLIFLSVLVDPQYKYDFVKFTLIEEWGQEIGLRLAKDVLHSLHELYDTYKLFYDPQNASSMQAPPIQEEVPLPKGTSRVMAEKYKRQKMNSSALSDINELDVYLSEKEVPWADGILVWWKLNQHRFPILSHVARDILGVPISTVASESAFSTGGRVLDSFRSSLSPKIAESLICTQDWLRRSKEQICIEETLEDIAKHEEDLKLSDDNEVSQTQTRTSPDVMNLDD